MKRMLGLVMAAALTTSVVGTAAVAAPNDNANPRAHEVAGKNAGKAKDNPGQGRQNPPGHLVDVQVLQFSDFHGHILPTDLIINRQYVGTYGGAAHLAGLIDQLRAEFGADSRKGTTHVVSSGDSIGGSSFESGLFQDEPTIEVLNAIGLVASAVGNHEFDEGVDELMRMIEGGNHPTLGQFGEEPYAGADFPYLAANVVWKGTDQPILPPYVVADVGQGAKVGYIGVVTDNTPVLVSPGGITDVEFLDEATMINHYAAELQAQGVEAIVALVHEGGNDDGVYSSPITSEDVNAGCEDLSGEITGINAATSPAVDVILSGHTHNAFACLLPDPDGELRAVNGPGDWGRVLSETTMEVNRKTGHVVRESLQVENHVVDANVVAPDAEVQALVDEWASLADIVGQQVVATAQEPITGDANDPVVNRGQETPIANLVADSILASAQSEGAQIAFMNVGGVRASLDEGPITYREAYNVLPFNNLINTLTMTGADIELALNQQFKGAGLSRPVLAFGVSEGFSYTWNPTTNSVVPGSMTLNGETIAADETYRVAVYNFLAEGGDGFSAFLNGTDLTGGQEDLAAFIAYLQANDPVSAPEDRVEGL